MIYRILFLLLFTCSLHAQTKTTLIVKLADCPDSTQVFVYNAIGKFANQDYMEKEVRVADHHFTVSLLQETPSFITLKSNCFKAELFTSPGDTVYIDVTEINGKTNLSFSGPNAAGLQLYSNSPYTTRRTETDLEAILSKAGAVTSAYEEVVTLIEGYKQPYTQLFQAGKINAVFYEQLSAAIEAFPVFLYANLLMSHFHGSSASDKSNYALDSIGLTTLLTKLYATYDPFDKKYLSLPNAYVYNTTKCNTIKLGLTTGRKNNVDAWQQLGYADAKYAVAPKSHQDFLMGKLLLLNLMNGYKPVDTVRKQLLILQGNAPGNPYIPIIKTVLAKTKPGPVVNENHDFYTYYDAKTDSLFMHLFSSRVDSLEEFVRRVFKGQPVFVDCWATWCPPCVAEFKYGPELYQFLEKNNVQMLFVSFDERTSRKVLPAIKGYKLHGYHYITNSAFSSTIKRIFKSDVIGIPRYLIFDREGKLVENDAYHPSTKEKLYAQIKEKLKL